MGELYGTLDLADLAAAPDGKVVKKVGGVWVSADESVSGFAPMPINATVATGPGPHALALNQLNLYDDSAADAFTMNIPDPPLDGDLVALLNTVGSSNPVVLSGQTKSVMEWHTLNVSPSNPSATATTIAMPSFRGVWKYIAAFSTWVPVDVLLSSTWGGVAEGGILNTAGPHVLHPMQDVPYDGSVAMTIGPVATPFDGETFGVTEVAGSGAASVTVSGNGNNLVNDAGSSVASMVLSAAYASRKWRWSQNQSIWAMIRQVN